MNNSRMSIRLVFFVTIILFAASAAEAHCVQRKPGQLEIILTSTIRTGASAVDQQWYKDCLNPSFSAWSVNGSQNLPVVAAAIGMFDKIETGPPVYKQTMPNSNKTYHQWWKEFLRAQTGVGAQPVPAELRYFHGTEAFSNTYDAPVVASVAAVHYWARKYSGATDAAEIATLARNYLRATWVIYGLAAVKWPANEYRMGTEVLLDGTEKPERTAVYPPATPQPDTQYNAKAPRRQDNSPLFSGYFIALAGARSALTHWSGDDRFPLFARAIHTPITKTNENFDQKDLLNELQGRWAAVSNAENLYGLSGTERTALDTLVQSGSNVSQFMPWIAGVRTSRTYRILGWSDGHRASVMENNPNGNTPCMYAIKFDPVTKFATFLHTWEDAGGATEGWARLEQGKIRAFHNAVYNNNGVESHRQMEAYITIPTANTQFHVVLSKNAAPYLEGAPPFTYPPGPPPRNDWPLNP